MKKLLRLIGNEEYRKWLEEHSELLWEKQYLHLIFTAPVDINEKLKLLGEYEADARKDKYASEYFDAARSYLKAAVRALNRQDSRVLFQLTEKRRCKIDPRDPLRDRRAEDAAGDLDPDTVWKRERGAADRLAQFRASVRTQDDLRVRRDEIVAPPVCHTVQRKLDRLGKRDPVDLRSEDEHSIHIWSKTSPRVSWITRSA